MEIIWCKKFRKFQLYIEIQVTTLSASSSPSIFQNVWLFRYFGKRVFPNPHAHMYAAHACISRCSADIELTYGNSKELQFDAGNVCRASGSEIIFLEHVEIEANLQYSRRGAIQMHLTAPSGIFLTLHPFITHSKFFVRWLINQICLPIRERRWKN